MNGISLAINFESGARVRNTYATYPIQGDSLSKERLIPHNIEYRHLYFIKVPTVSDGHAVD